jgi:glyoxylase-like metal-dependent hydrolase (beta-lactamase superfamily II)
MTAIGLPPSVRVIVRDWLSANHVVLRSPRGHVVIDTGYVSTVELTLALLASPAALGGEPLAKIVNTHCHSDHVGGNAALRRRYGCPIAVPAGEARAVNEWDQKTLLLDYAGQECERYRHDELLHPGERYRWGELDWEALATPGHDMGALVFHNREHRILISGDALWEHGFGFVMPPELDPACLPATRATLDRISALEVRTVIPGHGEPFHDVAAALERAYRRLEAFEADSMRIARHGAETGFYRDLNTTYFRQPPEALADWLGAELLAAGALASDGDDLVPARHRRGAG